MLFMFKSGATNRHLLFAVVNLLTIHIISSLIHKKNHQNLRIISHKIAWIFSIRCKYKINKKLMLVYLGAIQFSLCIKHNKMCANINYVNVLKFSTIRNKCTLMKYSPMLKKNQRKYHLCKKWLTILFFQHPFFLI